MSEPRLIHVTVEAGVAVLTLENPPLNLVTLELTRRLRAALARLAADDAARVLVVTGAGSRAFCAGSDVSEFPSVADDVVRKKLAPENAIALRELGLYLLNVGNYDLARRFLVRAVTADSNDKMAMGYLGCTMIRLGRPTEAQVWLSRAGPGDWSRCAATPPGQPMPGMPVPPGATTPRP